MTAAVQSRPALFTASTRPVAVVTPFTIVKVSTPSRYAASVANPVSTRTVTSLKEAPVELAVN